MKTNKKFRLKDVLPDLVRKYKTMSPSDLRKLVLQDYNKDLDETAFTKFFKRHPDVKATLQAEISSEVQSQIEVSGDMFENGNFANMPSIKKWNIEKATLVSPKYQSGHVGAIKLICQGVYFLKDKTSKKFTEVHIPDWQPKSPERLTLEQFQEFISHVHKANCCTNNYRIAFRDFWLSREGKTLKPSEVSGLMTSGTEHKLGRWKDVDVPKETLDKILAYVKEKSFTAYAADFTMYKTGCRISATLTEFLHEKLKCKDGVWVMPVTDKGFHRTGRQTFDKIITPDLLAVLNEAWALNGENAFAGLDGFDLSHWNKEAYRIFLVDDFNFDGKVKAYSALELGLASPNHFWRHMFGRKMLDATGYNYTAVAWLGSWKDEKMLHTVYGAAPMQMLVNAGLKFIPQI